ncbi:hypothetical protein LCGC14_1389530 [marine sediment metagenome]|uniref:DUF262 domain-containing protein n=1 Tax=marine sediment metagenome TaxID=412755 RepID=A0A0F9K0D2_9ZZZZ
MEKCTKISRKKKSFKFNNGVFPITRIVSLEYIIRNKQWLNLNPPYQRGLVWALDDKERFIYSVLMGRQIGAVHWVNSTSLDKIEGCMKDVLDSKQRMHTIAEWIDNKFSIPINFDDGAGVYEFYWKDFLDPPINVSDKTKEMLAILKEKLFTLQVVVSIHPPMSLTEQIGLFEDVNRAKPLTLNERMFARNCIAKTLLSYFFNELIVKYLNNHLRKEVKTNHRYSGLRFVHSALYLAFGPSLEDEFLERTYSGKNLKLSANRIENILIQHNFGANNFITDDIIKSIGSFSRTWKIFKEAVQCTADILDYNAIPKAYDNNYVMDIIVFFCNKIQKGTETRGHVQASIREFVEWTQKYHTKKINLTTRTTSTKEIEKRFEAMEDLYQSCIKDTGTKRKKATNADKLGAALASNGIDPLSGSVIGQNARTDHLDPAISHSETQFVTMTPASNSLKGAVTAKTAQNISKLHKEAKSNQD